MAVDLLAAQLPAGLQANFHRARVAFYWRTWGGDPSLRSAKTYASTRMNATVWEGHDSQADFLVVDTTNPSIETLLYTHISWPVPDYRDPQSNWFVTMSRLADFVDIHGNLKKSRERGPILLPSPLFFGATGDIRVENFTQPLGWFIVDPHAPQYTYTPGFGFNFRPIKPFTMAQNLPATPVPAVAPFPAPPTASSTSPATSAQPLPTPESVWQTIGLPLGQDSPPGNYAAEIAAAMMRNDESDQTFWEIMEWMTRWEIQVRVADGLPVLRYKGGALGYLMTNPNFKRRLWKDVWNKRRREFYEKCPKLLLLRIQTTYPEVDDVSVVALP